MNIALLILIALPICSALADTPPARWDRLSPRQKSAGLKVEAVSPCIFRLRAGSPDVFTPTHFRSAPPRLESLKSAPAGRLPFDLADVSFRTTERGAVVEIPLGSGERIFGFGLNTRLFNMNGRRVFIRTSDSPDNDRNDSHAAVPFYVSTAGYGVYVDTSRYASFYTGNLQPAAYNNGAKPERSTVADNTADLYRAREPGRSRMVVDIPGAKGADVYFFAGPTMADAVRRFNLFSGGGCLPPFWGLGVCYRGKGDFDAAQSLALAKQLRDEGIPCDIWGLEPGWHTHAYSCTYTWNTDRFPQPQKFIQRIRDMGFHLSAWEHAFVYPTSPIHAPLKAHSGNYLVWEGLVPDFADPEARRIFGDFHRSTLVDKGVDVFKLDECDNQPASPEPWSFPECSAFPSGLDGEQMHSLFGPLYQQTLLEALKADNIRSYGLVRASHALAAPLPFVIYSDSYDHRDYVRGIAKSGFSGLLWTPELRDAGSVEELYRRTESLVFSAQTVVNAWYLKNPPWKQINKEKNDRDEFMPDAPETTAGIRRLLELRMSLIPYLYSAFADYHFNGAPPFRAVVMDYPDDPETWSLDDEYLVGPSLLVAPLFAGEQKRSVYLPEGVWYDFWTHEKLAGHRKLEVTKDLGQIPVYVKEGSLLPLAAPVSHVAPDTVFALTVTAFGPGPASFTLYEDDGVSYDYEKGKQNRIDLKWDGKQGTATRTGSYTGPPRYKINAWNPPAHGQD
jgi:alpha-D-xyloside xylohydrolase